MWGSFRPSQDFSDSYSLAEQNKWLQLHFTHPASLYHFPSSKPFFGPYHATEFPITTFSYAAGKKQSFIWVASGWRNRPFIPFGRESPKKITYLLFSWQRCDHGTGSRLIHTRQSNLHELEDKTWAWVQIKGVSNVTESSLPLSLTLFLMKDYSKDRADVQNGVFSLPTFLPIPFNLLRWL